MNILDKLILLFILLNLLVVLVPHLVYLVPNFLDLLIYLLLLLVLGVEEFLPALLHLLLEGLFGLLYLLKLVNHSFHYVVLLKKSFVYNFEMLVEWLLLLKQYVPLPEQLCLLFSQETSPDLDLLKCLGSSQLFLHHLNLVIYCFFILW